MPIKKSKGETLIITIQNSRLTKKKRASLYVFLPVVIALVTSIIFHDIRQGSPWDDMILPVLVFSTLVTFLPISEEWQYKPWQSAARLLERELKE